MEYGALNPLITVTNGKLREETKIVYWARELSLSSFTV